MSGTFYLTLDTRPPGNPSLSIDAGAPVTATRDVIVTLSTSDYQGGQSDVAEMKFWGDVDSTADGFVQIAEEDSVWKPYSEDSTVRLSSGSGRKTIYGRLRDDVCNETLVVSRYIDLDLTAPVVTITSPVDRSRISKISPCNEALFSWTSSQPFSEYEVRIVPTRGSPYGSGVGMLDTYGSTHVFGSGGFLANTPITTLINGADLEVASPGNTLKVVKVYVLAEVWSP